MKKIYTYCGNYELNDCQINDSEIQESLENDDLETVLGYLATTDQIQAMTLDKITNEDEMENSDTWTYIDSTMSDYKFVGYVNIMNLVINDN